MRNPTVNRDTGKEDIWIKTACNMCFSFCSIRVHRVDGVAVAIEGNPDCPMTRGSICAKGASGLMQLYDPNRVNVPLKRTNPEKGIGVDPKWVEISWEEAMTTITEKLRKIKADDPRKLMGIFTVLLGNGAMFMTIAFAAAFGSPNLMPSGAGMHCGNGVHLFAGLMHCAWVRMPDPNYINYYLNFGCPSGFGTYYCATGMAQRMADARTRGMRHVGIEPWMGTVGSNSDEWIPIRPGTDGALALAMINLLLNEYGLYDVASIKEYTNGPYLVGEDGYYVRDKETQKPLMWDLVDGVAKTYDDPSIKDVAIEGSYSVNGAKARPAFSLLKEHVRKYTPEMVSEITTVPIETIRRVAKEFGEAASIGSTIEIDGKVLPYRPVATGIFKGASAHRHSALTAMAIEILQEIVGANNVPGGILGMNSRCLGYPETGNPSFSPSAGPDGLVQTGYWVMPPPPWPAHEPQKPQKIGMEDLVPTSGNAPTFLFGMIEPEKYKMPYSVEFALQVGGNYILSVGDPKLVEKAFRDVFTVSLNIFLDESTEFADIVLPDASYLERLDFPPNFVVNIPPVDDWVWSIRQPVVEPMFQRRAACEVILELAERLGLLGNLYYMMNILFWFKEPYLLDPGKKYTWEEIVDRNLKSNFGPERGLDWFKENGILSWPKKVEEMYWRPFIKARVPIYFEHFQKLGEQIEAIKKEYDIPGFDTSDFQPLPDWKPCAAHEEKRPEFDLIGIYYRNPVQTFSSTYENPLLDEVSQMDPYIYNVAINTETARKKGIKNGDWVIVESAGTGHKVDARAVLTDGLHPEVLAYASGGGHWAKHLPVASQKGKGIAPAWLIPLTWDYIDGVSLNQDLCVAVKVTKKIEET